MLGIPWREVKEVPLAAADMAGKIIDYWSSIWEKKTDPDTGKEYINIKKTHKDLTEGLGDVIVNYIKDNLLTSSPWVASYVPPSGSPVPDPMVLIHYTVALKSGYGKFKGGDTPAIWAANLNKLLQGAFELILPAAFNPAKYTLNPAGTVTVPAPTSDFQQNWNQFAVSVCSGFIRNFINPSPYSGVHNPVPATPFTGAATGMTLA
jgi:hypothetical protein